MRSSHDAKEFGMKASNIIGVVGRLWRFPVKSMGGERIEQGEFSIRGLVGDRAYALMDAETGKVVSAKSVKLYPDLLNCQAEFVEPPRLDCETPAAKITLPNGSSVLSDATDVNKVLSAFFRRDVTLARSAPIDYTIDQYHPDVENADPAGHRDTVVEQKLGSAFFAEAGLRSPVPIGAFFDLFPVSVLTTATLDRLSELQPDSRFDERRFRMNVIVKVDDARFVENDWVGNELTIGDTVRFNIALADPRCVMTTLAQGELPRDTNILRAIVRYNRVQVGDAGRFPCAGVYATVQASGTVRAGDRVSLV